MKTIIIILSLLTFASCKKCVTCNSEVTTTTYYYMMSNPDKHYLTQTDVASISEDLCEMSNKDIKAKEGYTGSVTEVVIGTKHYVTDVKIDCNCK